MATVKYVDLAGLTQFKNKLDARFPILGTDGKVPSSYLPSFVDDVLEYTSQSAFPSSGETGKIYVATDTNKTYRWSGSAYVEISASLALGETSSTAYAGNKGKANASAIAVLQGYFTNGVAKNADKLDGYDANHFVSSSTFQELSDAFEYVNSVYASTDYVDTAIAGISGGAGSLGNRVENLESSVEMLEGYIPGDLDIGELLASQQWVLDKKYLTSISLATSSAIGGIKIGYTTTGKNYAVQLSDGKAYVHVPWTNTTYNLASSSANGLMSSTHYTKLEGITTATTAEINALFA